MNKQRRNVLAKAIVFLEEGKELLEITKDEEQEAFDNLPENFQTGEKGEQMEGYSYQLEESVDDIQRTIDALQEIIDG